jgi:hypothetical protein
MSLNIGILSSAYKQIGLVLDLDAGNILSYPLTGTTWFDLSGNNNNATLINGASYNTDVGGNILFDGTNDYALVANSASLNNWSALSIGVWFKFTTSNSSYLRLIEKGANNEITIAINFNAPTYKLFLQKLGDTSVAITSTNALNDNKYHYAVVTIDSSYLCKLYIDGILNGQFQSTAPLIKTGDVNIGRFGGNGFFWNGNMAIIQIHNIVLSDTQITNNFNANKTRFGL